VKARVLEAFLAGVTLGIGMTLFSLYTRKPDHLAATLERITETGRARRSKEEEKRLRRDKLRAVGFTDEEIREIL
jgi:hypothetical protein